MHGLRWEEIENGVLTHRISKSLRGRKATMTSVGKVKRWTLASYPMVVEEFALIPEAQRHGPMIIAEHNGRPWSAKVLAEYWREYAGAVGIPDNVQNRDSRAGGASEAESAGADIDTIRQGMGHSRPDTTRIYTRAEDQATDNVAQLRVKSRDKNGPRTA
jgi:integrase